MPVLLVLPVPLPADEVSRPPSARASPRRRYRARTPPQRTSRPSTAFAARQPSPFATTLLLRRVTRPDTRRRVPRPPTTLRRVLRLATPRRAPRPTTAPTAATALTTIVVTAPTTAATATTSARATSDDLVDTRRLVAFYLLLDTVDTALLRLSLSEHLRHVPPLSYRSLSI